jgi:hypothetical protein
MNKRERNKFVRLATLAVTRAGGVPVERADYRFAITTRAGLLNVRICGDYGLTVFCRFEEPERARAAGIPCNPHSGKWNHHYGEHYPAESAASVFAADLAAALRAAEPAATEAPALDPFRVALQAVANGEATQEQLGYLNDYQTNPMTPAAQRDAIRRAKRQGGYVGDGGRAFFAAARAAKENGSER